MPPIPLHPRARNVVLGSLPKDVIGLDCLSELELGEESDCLEALETQFVDELETGDVPGFEFTDRTLFDAAERLLEPMNIESRRPGDGLASCIAVNEYCP